MCARSFCRWVTWGGHSEVCGAESGMIWSRESHVLLPSPGVGADEATRGTEEGRAMHLVCMGLGFIAHPCDTAAFTW